MATHTTRRDCRLCHHQLIPLFTIDAPLVSAFPPALDPPEPVSVPLEVVQCERCQHVQLRHTVDPQIMYGEYWYESGVNERMREELRNIVYTAQMFAALDQGDHILDIGANDGTLLSAYPRTIYKVAVEPAATFTQKLMDASNELVQGTFPECVQQLPPVRFKIITSIAMFYDLEDPVAAAAAIRQLLHPYGVWVCQFQDLEAQVRLGVWDNFVHEHLSYHTLQTFAQVCYDAGLEVVHVETSDINGGSLRVFVRHRGVSPVAQSIIEQRDKEDRTLTPGWPERFAARVRRNIAQIQSFVDPVLDAGGVVDLYGASTKGNTLLQATGYDHHHIRAAWERNPRKVGRTTVNGVPIIDEALGRHDPPDLLLTTIWQFKQQILQREMETLRTTRMVLPLPEGTLVERSGRAAEGRLA